MAALIAASTLVVDGLERPADVVLSSTTARGSLVALSLNLAAAARSSRMALSCGVALIACGVLGADGSLYGLGDLLYFGSSLLRYGTLTVTARSHQRDKTKSPCSASRARLKKQGFPPDVIITDKLRSYVAAKIE